MKKLFFAITVLLVFNIGSAQTVWMNETKLKGTIGKYPIAMILASPYGGASSCITIGKYYYVSKKKAIDLCSEDDEKIIERIDDTETGYFVLNDNWDKKIGQVVLGKWYTMDGRKSYPVILRVVGKGKN
jgi:hypothetical protein